MKGHQWNHISDDAKDLVHRMLELDQCHRITIDEVLRHPWIRVHVLPLTFLIIPLHSCRFADGVIDLICECHTNVI